MILRTIILPSSKIIQYSTSVAATFPCGNSPDRSGKRSDRAVRQTLCSGRFHTAKLTEVYPRQGRFTSGRPGNRPDFHARPAPVRGVPIRLVASWPQRTGAGMVTA